MCAFPSTWSFKLRDLIQFVDIRMAIVLFVIDGLYHAHSTNTTLFHRGSRAQNSSMSHPPYHQRSA